MEFPEPAHRGTAMEYKGIPFEITQLATSWKWTVFIDAARMQTGVALTRADAVLDAEIAIDEMLKSVKRNGRRG